MKTSPETNISGLFLGRKSEIYYLCMANTTL